MITKMMVRPSIIEAGMLRSGRLVSSTSGQTNSAPTKPHTAMAVRAITPRPMGFQLAPANRLALGMAPSLATALRPMTSSTTVMTTANTVCKRAKMSMLNRFSTVNSDSTPKATLSGGNACG
ncbi:hypothetical protein D9M71_499900 [compost metagenome]